MFKPAIIDRTRTVLGAILLISLGSNVMPTYAACLFPPEPICRFDPTNDPDGRGFSNCGDSLERYFAELAVLRQCHIAEFDAILRYLRNRAAERYQCVASGRYPCAANRETPL